MDVQVYDPYGCVHNTTHIHQVCACVSIRSTGYVVVRQMAISSQCHER